MFVDAAPFGPAQTDRPHPSAWTTFPAIPRFSSVSIMPCRWYDLTSKDLVADHGVDQHQREDEETLSPKHESETGMGCGSLLDRDRERDHVGPERDRQRANRGREDECHHVVRHCIPATPYAFGRHDRGDDADRRKDKQIRPLEPSVHDPKIFGQGVYEDDNKEGEQSSRQIRDQTIGFLADIALAFPDQPTSAEQGIAET